MFHLSKNLIYIVGVIITGVITVGGVYIYNDNIFRSGSEGVLEQSPEARDAELIKSAQEYIEKNHIQVVKVNWAYPGCQQADSAECQAYPGCWWEAYKAPKSGLEFNRQVCLDSMTIKEDSATGDIIFFYDRSDGVQFTDKYIEIFSKDSSEKSENVIKNNFIAKLNLKEQSGCYIAQDKDIWFHSMDMPLPKHISIYRIFPTEARLNEINKGLWKEGEWPSCGEYEGTRGFFEGSRYFLFDDRSPSKYLFIDQGVDPPMFDIDSLAF